MSTDENIPNKLIQSKWLSSEASAQPCKLV